MRLRHALSRLHYIRQEDGTVLVDDEKGRSGVFDRAGNWVSGDRRIADPMLCLHVSDAFVPKQASEVWTPFSSDEETKS